jgi:multiple sugar transport system permease protein/raffinose/stachyose/melibiose transport system permease protein
MITASRGGQRGGARSLLGKDWQHLLFLAPAVLFFIGFVAYPIVSVIGLSITARDVASVGTGPLANYTAVLTDPVFWTATRNMVVWAVVTIFVQMVVGGLLAYLINKYARRSAALLRTAFLIPMVTSASVIAIVWQQIYAPSYGPLENILARVGINFHTSLLGGASTAILAVIVINIWEYTGFSMLLYVVGLHRIPSEILDAAYVDGASGWRLARRILIPLLSPTTKSLLLLGIIGTLQTFALVYLTTSGGPNHASEVFGTQIFRADFLLNETGYAAALSVITLAIALFATVLQLRVLRSGLVPTARKSF